MCLRGTRECNDTDAQMRRWVTKGQSGESQSPPVPPAYGTHPSCPFRNLLSIGTHHTQPFRCNRQAISSGKGETRSRRPAWKSLGQRGCLRRPSGSQEARESRLRLQPAVSGEESPLLDAGFPRLLGDAQYRRRCKSGQSEDFIYII